MTSAPPDGPEVLRGKRIAVAEGRELALFAGLLERRGAEVLRLPLVRIVDAPDPAPLLGWLRGVAAGGCDDLIWFTGEGLHRLFDCLGRHEPALRAPLLAAFARARHLCRGPKPARALRELGIAQALSAASPTTDGIIATVREMDLSGNRVGLQLHGDEPAGRLQQCLRDAGASVLPVWPYRYAPEADPAAIDELLRRMRAGEVHAIAFTSLQQVERLYAAASPETVTAALEATSVAAVGPLVAAALRERGIRGVATPEDNWFLKPLTRELVKLLGPQPP